MSNGSVDSVDVASTTHNFNTERPVLMVLGGNVILKAPTIRRLLDLLYLGAVVLVFVYLIAMAITTMVLSIGHKAVVVQASQVLCLLLVGLALPASKLCTDPSLDLFMSLLRRGVHRYLGEAVDPEHDRIKRERVEQIRLLMTWVTKLTMLCAFSNTFFLPLAQVLGGTRTAAGSQFNPYLPLQVLVPFDTDNPYGFAFAFLTDAVFFFFLYAAIACLIETYLSLSLQLIAQLEILNYSIRNIERRAFLKVVKHEKFDPNTPITDDLYESWHFQRHLYLCMRENILHHQAIMRMKEAAAPFLEAINSICIMSFSIVFAASFILIMENPTMNVALISTLTSDIYCYYEMCRVGQVITDMSIEVAQSLYASPWYKCRKPYTDLLQIFLSNTQKPIVMRATGFNASASLQTYSEMMTLGYKLMNVFR